MSKGQSLQDPFLNALRKDRIPVSIFLVNGIKLQGQIESFDQYVVLLKNTVSQMVYKHAISTVVPTRNPRTDGSTPNPNYPSTPIGVMSGSNYQGNAYGSQGFERQGSFERNYSQTGMGFDPRQGGFDRSSYEERGFDGQNFEKPENRSFDNKAFDSKEFDNKFDQTGNE